MTALKTLLRRFPPGLRTVWPNLFAQAMVYVLEDARARQGLAHAR